MDSVEAVEKPMAFPPPLGKLRVEGLRRSPEFPTPPTAPSNSTREEVRIYKAEKGPLMQGPSESDLFSRLFPDSVQQANQCN